LKPKKSAVLFVITGYQLLLKIKMSVMDIIS